MESPELYLPFYCALTLPLCLAARLLAPYRKGA